MNHTRSTIHPALAEYMDSLQRESDLIGEERRALLTRLANYIRQKAEEGQTAHLNFICTHNSRRSQLAQLWATTGAALLGLTHINTYSGGTEATAFNPRAVAAAERAGFVVDNPGGENPRYEVSFSPEVPPLVLFSKVFDDPVNPTEGFAAVMTCSDADENCPFIPGAELRLPLTYDDPKEADDTPGEAARYDERLRQIGRELLFALSLIQTNQAPS